MGGNQHFKTKIVFSILISFLVVGLIGCSGKQVTDEPGQQSIDGIEEVETGQISTEETSEEITAEKLYSAKDAYVPAQDAIRKKDPAAVFVGAEATIDENGKSSEWTYSFDSMKNSKGYEVRQGNVREGKFSFKSDVKSWVDSTKLAQACGPGDAVLEEGKWTVVDGEHICEIDAETGEKDEN